MINHICEVCRGYGETYSTSDLQLMLRCSNCNGSGIEWESPKGDDYDYIDD